MIGGAVAPLLVIAIAVAAFYLVTRGDETTTATPQSSSSESSPADSSPSGSATPTPSATNSATSAAAPSSSPSKTKRPPTLELRLSGDSYVSVQVAGGRMLVSKLLHKGDHRSFNQKTLIVVLGNSAAVAARVNGKLLARGEKGQVKSFVARRK